MAMDRNLPIKKRRGAKLPHWEQEGADYAVTFRLADSLPRHVIDQLALERRQLEREIEMTGTLSDDEKSKRLDWLLSEKVERWLDNCFGECVLRRPEAAETVANALKHFDGIRYQLLAWCVMPNHVHVAFRSFADWDLKSILHSWKTFTAFQINQLRGKKGMLWQSEYYDHLIRGPEDLEHCIQYILNNPVKAALSDWRWVWSKV